MAPLVESLAPFAAAPAVDRWRALLLTPFSLTAVENDLNALNSGEPVGQVSVERGVVPRHDDEQDERASVAV